MLNGRWQQTLGEPMDLGIGVNTGPAQVGNTGSRHKFKYGPLGNTVNLASRVQGLTKYLHCRLLVTAATRRELGEHFITRRVCRTRVVNIREPVDLFEVEAAGDDERAGFFRASEAAFGALERRNFAARRGRWGHCWSSTTATARCCWCCRERRHMLMHPESAFDPIWEPPGK